MGRGEWRQGPICAELLRPVVAYVLPADAVV